MLPAIKPATEETVKERKLICQQCEHFSVFFCKQCGCVLEAKIRLEVATCPLNKW
jgi:hypothetical protein